MKKENCEIELSVSACKVLLGHTYIHLFLCYPSMLLCYPGMFPCYPGMLVCYPRESWLPASLCLGCSVCKLGCSEDNVCQLLRTVVEPQQGRAH